MKPSSISLALGEEYIPPLEAEQIEQIVALHRDVQEKMDRKQTPVPRGQHPKQHGCVLAEFIIEPTLRDDYRHGLFSEPHIYPALVRFSNGKQHNDQLPDAHGMAIKVLGLKGASLLHPGQETTTQDFVLLDHPVFFVKNVADYIPLMNDFRRLATGGFLAKSATVMKGMFSLNYKFKILRATGKKRPDSPLRIQYWSTTPFKLGSGAIKISARPDLRGLSPLPPSTSKDKLRLALSEHLETREARFDFLVQLQTDPITMPIEDPTARWDETVSPYQKVATLRIPPQSFASPEQMAFGENLSFSPWHGLQEHRPLGGINRTRRKVYEAMAARRRELNHAQLREPTLQDFRIIQERNR